MEMYLHCVLNVIEKNIKFKCLFKKLIYEWINNESTNKW